MKQLIECVPNFSEGRDPIVLDKITEAIRSVEGVKLLDIDPGKATNRTVFTFVGEPEPVIEAAFRAIKVSSELIDMSKHSGEHPRMGACDVCPLIPISGISMEETVEYAKKLGEKVGKELNLSGYFYEFAASSEERRNLATVRAGEYEGFAKKILLPDWKPDFGPAVFNAKFGAMVIGARNFLVAYNINLNTTSTRRANAIAFDVREAGRVVQEHGKNKLDAHGEPIRVPGKLKAVKAIGWYIEEYGVAQISMNLTDITITKVHEAFDAVEESAIARGIRVTGSELVGLIPLNALLDAGKHYLRKQERSLGVPESEIIKIAVKSLGLDELRPFEPRKKIIEYLLEDEAKKLADLSITAFADETSSESPAPGGGSISAYVGSLGASLATMVANLSSHRRGWDERWEFFSDWAETGQNIKNELIKLVDEDTQAFNKIMEAFRLPNGNEEEKVARKHAIQEATKYAAEVPLKIMKVAASVLPVAKAMATEGMKSSASDVGVGALCVQTAVEGAFLNVKINVTELEDQAYADILRAEGKAISENTQREVADILALVNAGI